MIFKERYEKFLDEIREICIDCGRNSDEIQICLVTKTHNTDTINDAIKSGVTLIGENRVQEILEKLPNLAEVNIHQIGHLQTNKVKYIIDIVDCIQSVDSIKLLQEIDKHAGKNNKIMNILVQVNVAGETQKNGISPDELDNLIQNAILCKNIKLLGLMNIAPNTDNEELLRKNFSQMKKLFDYYSKEIASFKYLSMGMSSDYKIAIECGANLLRIGSYLLGDR